MIVDVAVPFRVGRTFHYALDLETGSQVQPGSLVQVSFRRKTTHAFVLGFPESSDVASEKLKNVDQVLISQPLLDKKMLELARWISSYYHCPLGEVLSSMVPRDAWDAKPSKRKLKDRFELSLVDLPQKAVPELTPAQQQAIQGILGELNKPTLLYGVTGSGKTEVYMRVLETCLAQGKSGIVLAPEIALTPQLLHRFASRFPGLTAVLHSDLTPKERHLQWQRIYAGEARVVIGARSAIFAPVKSLGLIVVDEEQESSFKQEDSLRYHARDVAVVRGRLNEAKVLLGSATPSLESYLNAKNEKYNLVCLKERIEARPLPRPVFVDLKDSSALLDPKSPWISKVLLEKMQGVLEKKQQVLLYLNRLGFAHFLFCRDCGYAPHCNNCDVSLTYYQRPAGLKCHYCGSQSRPPETCPQCRGMRFEPMGVGTEQLEKQLKALFPKARIARMDRGVIKTRKALERLLSGIAKGDWDIVIGTQMITKGHDFPNIALVGILVADASLNLPDFRANERTFQIVTQVAGRAGRAEVPGEVVIQTLNPEHFALRAAGEHRSDDFYNQELQARQNCAYPPYVRLALLRFQHSNRDRVRQFAHQTVLEVQRHVQGQRISLIGPAEAPLSRVKRLYRWQCLIKGASVKDVQYAVGLAHSYFDRQKASVQMAVDVDPLNLS